MYKLKRMARKFWCLKGFVAAIFTVLALRAIYVTFICLSIWNVMSAILLSIFAYWWLKIVLATRTTGGSGYDHNCSNSSSRDLDL